MEENFKCQFLQGKCKPGKGKKHIADFMFAHHSASIVLMLTQEPFHVCVLMKREIVPSWQIVLQKAFWLLVRSCHGAAWVRKNAIALIGLFGGYNPSLQLELSQECPRVAEQKWFQWFSRDPLYWCEYAQSGTACRHIFFRWGHTWNLENTVCDYMHSQQGCQKKIFWQQIHFGVQELAN